MGHLNSKEIIYAGDPICAWCWGFSKVFDDILYKLDGKLPVTILMGGLRVDEPVSITGDIVEKVRNGWKGVSEKTGQDFSLDLIGRIEGMVFDSDPPNRAVITVKKIKPDFALYYYKLLHKSLYLEMKDIFDPTVLSGLAEKIGIGRNEFLNVWESEDAMSETRSEYKLAEELGALALPSLLLKENGTIKPVAHGYKPFSIIWPQIKDWLEGRDEITEQGRFIFT